LLLLQIKEIEEEGEVAKDKAAELDVAAAVRKALLLSCQLMEQLVLVVMFQAAGTLMWFFGS
jgi:hypothetical protein